MVLRRNILLFHQGALGDFIVTWPLALALARVFAQSRVFYITSSQKGGLAEKALGIEWADVEHGWHQLFSSEPKLDDRAARLLDGAQWIISFVSSGQDRWAANVSAIAPHARLITLITTPPPEFPGHVTEFLLSQLAPWTVIETAFEQMLRSIQARGLGGIPRPQGPVVLHPGAGSGKKCWPPDQFLRLAQKLNDRGQSVQVLLGETELEKWPADQIERFTKTAQVHRPATLLELMERLCAAAAFVGNDSGPGHLAGILGLQAVSIFGPSDPIRWRPLGPRVRVIHDEWDRIDVPRVLDQVAYA